MNVSLTRELEKFVEQEVESGHRRRRDWRRLDWEEVERYYGGLKKSGVIVTSDFRPRKPIAHMLVAAYLCGALGGCDRTPSSSAPPTANSTVNGGVFTKNVTISGQVFIVTQGGENVKLGLVRVAIADSKTVEDYRKTISDGINSTLSTAKTGITQAMPDYQAAKDKYDKLLPDYTNAQNALQSALSANSVQYLDTLGEVLNVTSAQAANIVKLDKQRAGIGAKLAPLHDDLVSKERIVNDLISQQQGEVGSSATSFIDSFPEEASTKTDADGKFSLSVPAGSTYVIVAKASRSVGDDTEYYSWIVDVDLTTANDGLTEMLSNDNLVGSVAGIQFVPGLSVDTSLIADTLPPPDPSVGDIVSQPTTYTFKDSSYSAITPDDATADTTTDTATAPAAPTVPAWTPPNPLPAQDNWTWAIGNKAYQNVVVLSCNTDDDSVSITHSMGVAHMPMSSLPSEIQKKLNYTPAP